VTARGAGFAIISGNAARTPSAIPRISAKPKDRRPLQICLSFLKNRRWAGRSFNPRSLGHQIDGRKVFVIALRADAADGHRIDARRGARVG
jgi:hypothetical protein